jgi:hypothetical protein
MKPRFQVGKFSGALKMYIPVKIICNSLARSLKDKCYYPTTNTKVFPESKNRYLPSKVSIPTAF